MRLTLTIVAAALATLATPLAAQTPLPQGYWINPHRSVAVRTGACGAHLCGWVTWAAADAQSDARDAGVPHLIGTELLEDYAPNGAHAWSGTVYVPDMNRRFSSQIEQRSADQLKIKGCIIGGLICRSQTWTRVDHLPNG